MGIVFGFPPSPACVYISPSHLCRPTQHLVSVCWPSFCPLCPLFFHTSSCILPLHVELRLPLPPLFSLHNSVFYHKQRLCSIPVILKPYCTSKSLGMLFKFLGHLSCVFDLEDLGQNLGICIFNQQALLPTLGESLGVTLHSAVGKQPCPSTRSCGFSSSSAPTCSVALSESL